MAANLYLQSDVPVRVLLLEDSDIDAELVSSHLYKAGLQYSLIRAVDRDSFVSALESHAFDVILAEVGANKIQVIKELRAVTTLGLKEAKDLVDAAPKPIKNGASKEEANTIKQKLEAVGAKVELK